MKLLTFSLFGSLHIQTATQATDLPLTPKIQALLAFLIIEHDRAHARDWVATFLWPDSPEAAGRNNLRQSLFVLRQRLGSHADALLQITPRTLQWIGNPATVEVDVLRFDRLLAEAGNQTEAKHLRALEQAVAFYRAPLLHGMSESGSDRFDEWLTIQQTRLEQKTMAALLRLCEEATKRGDLARAQRFAQRQIEIDPLNEPAFRQLMQLLAQAGDSTAALAHYATLVDLLQKELDVAPMPETTALAEQIQGGRRRAIRKTVKQWDSGTVATVSDSRANPQSEIQNPKSKIQNLPLPLMPLIGRTSEVASILQQMGDPECRLLTLIGTAGVGKTRLALQAAQQLRDTFVDGVVFVSMVELTDPTQIVATLIRALAVTQIDGRADLTMLQSYLRPRQLLLVIDNFEQIVSGAAQLVDLLQAAPLLKCIVTSRELLRVYGEQVLAVPALPLPDLAKVDSSANLASAVLAPEIVASPAVQLFVQHARTVKPDFALTVQNQTSVAQLCSRLDGLPLALELAAARTRLLSPEKMLEQLSSNVHRSGLLKSSISAVPARQKTLAAAIDWSYQLLNAEEQRLFRQLAVFAGGACLDEVCAVCLHDFDGARQSNLPAAPLADMSADNDTVIALLESLLDKSLVYYTDPSLAEGEDVEPRLEMLLTIREYALQKLIEQQELRSLQARHAQVYLMVARQFDPYNLPAPGKLAPQQLKRWLRLRHEHANFQAALQWCFGDIQQLPAKHAHNPVLGIELLAAISMSWHTRNYEQGCAWTTHAVRLIEADRQLVSRALQAQMYHDAGQLRYHTRPHNDPFRADELLQQAIVIFQALEDEKGAALSLTWLLHHYIAQQNWAAVPPLRLQLEQLADHAPGSGLVLLGRMAFIGGDLARARGWLQRAEEQSNSRDDQLAWSYAVCISGILAMKEESWQHSEAKQWQALALTRKLRRKDIQMYILTTLAEIALLRNRPATTLELTDEALPLARDAAYHYGVALLLLLAATALAMLNRGEERLDDLLAVAHRLIHGNKPPDLQVGLAYPRAVGYARQAVGEARLAKAQSLGSSMSVDEAIALVKKVQRSTLDDR